MPINFAAVLDQKLVDVPIGIISGIATFIILYATAKFWKALLRRVDSSKRFVSNDKYTNFRILWAAYKSEDRLRFMQWACMKEFINFCIILLCIIGITSLPHNFGPENEYKEYQGLFLIISVVMISHLAGRVYYKIDMIQFVYMARYFPILVKERAIRRANANRIKHMKAASKMARNTGLHSRPEVPTVR
jgi:hypothetical protein